MSDRSGSPPLLESAPATRAVPASAARLAADIAAVARIDAVPTILKVISESLGLRLALIARVTNDAWTCCAVLDRMAFGLEVGGQLDVVTTLCSEVRDCQRPIVIEHASAEPEYCNHPTPKMYGFESYVAVPIYRTNGEYFGTVCALDSAPRTLRDPKTMAMLALFAELISLQLTADEASERDREALCAERETAELREQFIAVLGHDLRNPLSSILAGATLLGMSPLEPAQRTVLQRIQCSGDRMSRLIDDITDFARGRLGGGMTISREPVDMGELANEVIQEIAAAYPARPIRFVSTGAGTAWLDRSRVSQLLSNLVANAVQHSPAESPVVVTVGGEDAHVTLSVANRGRPIAPSVAPRLFQPYFRSESHRAHSGLGLGLYIVSEIAAAHGGTIEVTALPDGETTFTATLPRGTASAGCRR